MILLLLLALQAPAIPAGAVDAARMMDFRMGRVSTLHNEQFIDAWIKYNETFTLWWLLTQQNAGGVNVDGTGVYSLELLRATGQLKKAALQLLHEVKKVHDRVDDLVDATKKAPPS